MVLPDFLAGIREFLSLINLFIQEIKNEKSDIIDHLPILMVCF